MSRDPPTAVAVVGCGTVADRYVEGLLAEPTLELVAAADLDRERARAVADRAPGCRAFGDAAAALDATDPGLVVNLTSHDAHAAVTRTCLEAGADVFSEKPLATEIDAARELVALAADRDRRLGCAPISHLAPTARRLRTLLDEGRLGPLRLVDARCHVGRLTEWHDAPESFLRAGPLLDGAVYPLTVLTSLLGPVRRVRSADRALLAADHEHGGRRFAVDTPDHAVATLAFERPAAADPAGEAPRTSDGQGGRSDPDRVLAQLTASMYVPYRTREFVSAELHGDDGSLYVADVGGLDAGDRDRLRFARLGRDYGPVPRQGDADGLSPADGPAEFAAAAREGRPSPVDAARAVHVLAVVDAIERAADGGGPVDVPAPGAVGSNGGVTPGPSALGVPEPDPWPTRRAPADAPAALALPPIGFGCARYRGDGEYVDLAGPIERALDAGYRLFDAAELYGVEGTLGEVLARPGSPDREAVTLVSKVWNTNHAPDHVRAACEASLDRLRVDALDGYLIHWPDAWAHQGPLEDVAELSHAELEALAFPTDGDGDPAEADVPLATTWRAVEGLVDDGLVDWPGICNVDLDTLRELCADARRQPAVVQVERHPYRPRDRLVDWCRDHGIRVLAHSPLSAPGLLDEPALASVAADNDVSPAGVALRWHVERDVVPIPSTTDPAHVVENLDVFGFELDGDELARLDGLRDPEFSR